MGDQGGQYLDGDYYPTVVVGSGFGGAVAACRLAQAGLEVAVLERGRRWPPGSFPRELSSLGSGWWWGHRHGLYDVSPLADLVCVRAAGWGGGSLLYANVVMRPTAAVFEQTWPEPYRRPVLDPYFDLAAHMLEVTPVQLDPTTGELPPKTRATRASAERLGDHTPLFHPNLAVRFADDPDHPGTNRFGVAQSPCVGCGRCDIGGNYGAKNTLDLNYLALAERHGATVATLTEVTHLGRRDGRYELHLHQHGDADVERRTITADRVILGAGALGSTEILLRSRDQHATLPDLPAALGHGYSANGDFLAFGDGTADLVSAGTGPTITTAYGLRTSAGEEFYVEDGGYPNELAMLLRRTVLPRWLRRRPPVVDHDAVLLSMGRDRSDGRIRLDRRHRLRVDWDTAGHRSLYAAAERVSADVIEALGGRPATTWLWRYLRRAVSVHHLGGCAMSTDPDRGVVDTDGQVHGHPELYVLDGAVVPAATGANPSHTITAVAERCTEQLVRRLTGDPAWTAPESLDVQPVAVPEDQVVSLALPDRTPARAGIRLREQMRGTYRPSPGAAPEPASFALTFHIDDLDTFLTDPQHILRLTGRVNLPPLTGPRGAAVHDATLRLFAPADGVGARSRRIMAYAVAFHDLEGRRWELHGRKDIWHQRGFDLWPSTTTLRLALHSPDGSVDDDAGTLRLSPLGVLAGLASARATHVDSPPAAARHLLRFLFFFADQLRRVYLTPSLLARDRRR